MKEKGNIDTNFILVQFFSNLHPINPNKLSWSFSLKTCFMQLKQEN